MMDLQLYASNAATSVSTALVLQQHALTNVLILLPEALSLIVIVKMVIMMSEKPYVLNATINVPPVL